MVSVGAVPRMWLRPRVDLFAAFLSALSLAVLFGAPAAIAEPDNKIRLPEYFLRNMATPVCVFEIEITDPSESGRKKSLLSFIRASYEATGRWRHNYVVGGIDYVGFSSFKIIFFGNCTVAKKALSQIQEQMPKTFREQGDGVSKSPIISSLFGFQRYGSPAAEFESTRSSADLSRCLVFAPLKRATDFFPVDFALTHAMAKYRMPVFDHNWANGGVYFLFGRECDDKKILYSELLEFATETEPRLGNELGAPDFHPHVQPYLDREGAVGVLHVPAPNGGK
jgi:hypothetical protein